MTEAPFQRHFADRMSLQQVDRDIFTGWCHSGSPLRAYGGQIAAQSLMAAGHTVDGDERRVHSLHGYFLRPGQTKDSITYLVDRPRDGRSFSTRVVRAVQHGETIFMMTASFAVTDEGPSHQFTKPDLPRPDMVADIPVPLPAYLEGASTPGELDYPDSAIIGLRIVEPNSPITLEDGRYERMAWVRIEEDLPDDSLIQSCALTYLSDLTMVSTALAPHSGVLQRPTLQLASIDHAVWFHAPTRADQWLLFAQDTPSARGGHGLARGLFFDGDGTLVASVVQESLMRIEAAVILVVLVRSPGWWRASRSPRFVAAETGAPASAPAPRPRDRHPGRPGRLALRPGVGAARLPVLRRRDRAARRHRSSHPAPAQRADALGLPHRGRPAPAPGTRSPTAGPPTRARCWPGRSSSACSSCSTSSTRRAWAWATSSSPGRWGRCWGGSRGRPPWSAS